MSIFGLVYSAIWNLTQLVSILIDFWGAGFRRLEEWFLRSYDLFAMRQEEDEITYLMQQKCELLKLPAHVCIVIGIDECHSPKALSKITFYSLVMGIPCISFYDPMDKFSLDQLQAPVIVNTTKTKNGRVLWTLKGVHDKSTCKNGLENTLEIIMIRRKDGKPLVAEVCRDLFAQRHKTEVQEAIRDRAVMIDTINKSLQEKLHNLTNPDLVILFNKFLCTFGLLPWHTGFSEFHLIENGSYFNAKMFAKVLFKYAKCEQRFGR